MRMTTWDVLERHFDGLTAEEVDAELDEVVSGQSPASSAAAAYLAEHGGPDLDGEARAGSIPRRRALTAAATLTEMLHSAMTLDETAATLGISRSRVSHRISGGRLWAFTVQGRRYVPRWQITDDGDGKAQVIPGLEVVTPAIPNTVHPLGVAAFMTVAHEDFSGQSPVEWLISGGDPSVVAAWLTGMGRW